MIDRREVPAVSVRQPRLRIYKRLTALLAMVLTTATLAAEPLVTVDSIDAYAKNLYPLGTYDEYVGAMFGAGTQVNLLMPAMPMLRLFGSVGYTYGVSDTIWVNSFHDLLFDVGFGAEAPAFGPALFGLDFAYGWINHIVSGDIDRDGEEAVNLFTDQHIRITSRLIYPFTPDLAAFVAPNILAFLEKDLSGAELGFDLGLRVGL